MQDIIQPFTDCAYLRDAYRQLLQNIEIEIMNAKNEYGLGRSTTR